MSYVDKHLLPNEVVLHRAKLHWSIYAPGLILIAIAAFLFAKEPIVGGEFPDHIFSIVFIVFGFLALLKAIIVRMSTEMAITSKRVIAKTGFVIRSSVELNHSKLESICVEQSILGRLLGFGTLILNGTGGGKTPVPNINAPLQFRSAAMRAADPA